VGKSLSVAKADLCRRVISSFKIDIGRFRDFFYPTELLAAGAAVVNEPDFPLHLAAVKILLLKLMNDKSPYIAESGDILAKRDSGNPFFLYLSEGPSARVLNSVLTVCPSAANPVADFNQQSSWERPSSGKPWLHSMYWDCIFMGRLLGAK
jgi:hypothetical protein